jgi:hypothetical protein
MPIAAMSMPRRLRRERLPHYQRVNATAGREYASANASASTPENSAGTGRIKCHAMMNVVIDMAVVNDAVMQASPTVVR